MDQSLSQSATAEEEWDEWRARWGGCFESAGIFNMSMGNRALSALSAMTYMDSGDSESNAMTS